ncbi:alpha/beta hydrolase [Sphaerisporangium sp. NPDC051017]|uniref:alpha/beta fold hydrolase n=1 Tax=Sphaerisporangium sp. NPDC051017 TaxID=3154636 RepID=UPI00342678AC
MGHVEVDAGVRLFVQDVGAGPTVVLLAGLGMHHEVWDREVRLLAESHRVLCVDVRGHGLSDKPLHGYEVERLTADVRAVLRALEVDRCAVVGWSFGGQIGFHLAAAYPGLVERLVLVGSNAVRATRSEEFPFGRRAESLEAALVGAEERDRVAARRTTIASGIAAEVDPHVLDWLVSSSLRMPSWSAIACYRSMIHSDLMEDLPKIGVPVLQIVGEADPVHPADGARWLNERLADARIVELPGCGHYPMVEAPEEFDGALRDFLSEVVTP